MASKKNPLGNLIFFAVLGFIVFGNINRWKQSGGSSSSSNSSSHSHDPRTFRIVSGSENKELEPILQRFAKKHKRPIEVKYLGSVDIMLQLEEGRQMDYDAVWPANSLWITLGDSHKVVKHDQSILHSPVVLGVKQSVAIDLGWDKNPVKIADVLEAAEAGKLKFGMTSATQSNSGASAYLGFLHALADSPDVLSMENLQDKEVQARTKRLLHKVQRSSGSSGWLKDMMIERPDEIDAMFNYESMIIEANKVFQKRGQEPLIAIYPEDGIIMADSPLGYVNKGDHPEKEDFFRELQAYLLSEEVQNEILAMGRRTGLMGLNRDQVDEKTFNPAWGIDVDRVISSVPLPNENVIREALMMYQEGGLRKPSATAYVLDFSGSMTGAGEADLKRAMRMLLDPAQSRRFFLQPSDEDIHIFVPFDSSPREAWIMKGNDPSTLSKTLGQVEALQAGGGTDIYAGLIEGIQELQGQQITESHFPSVLLMTDGRSQGSFAQAKRAIEQSGIPVYPIAFGNADDGQLKPLAEQSGARVFHGHSDLSKAFRKAKGYN